MKPNFALTLSFDGIGLLHRAFPGWHLVGEVSLDSPDLNAELSEMRHKALALDPSGLRCKLVLPDDQVKYLTIDDVATDADVETVVRKALEGATPYPVDDLAFDWSREDGKLSIAAVARETLSEAETFATDHQFNPISYVAAPENGAFAGEPFFGTTRWLRKDAGDAAVVARDSAPIRVIGAAKLPGTGATGPKAPAEPKPQEAPAEPEPQETPAAAPAAPVEKAARPPAAQPETAAEGKKADPAPKTGLTLPAAPPPIGDTAPQPDADDTAATTDGAEFDETAPAAAFASIRARRDNGSATPPLRLDGAKREAGPSRITLGPAAKPVPTPAQPPAVTGVSDAAIPADDVEIEVASPAPEKDDPPAEDEPKPAFFSRRSRGKTKSATKAARIPEPATERQRMTVFGAREPETARGKPRYLGVILTAVLLIFLICVAAWASIFLDDGLARFFRSDPAPAVADLPATTEPALAEMDADVELASIRPEDPVSVLDDPATEILSRVNPSDLSPDEAKARYAATGIWQLAPEPSEPPQPTELEEFYQTSLDPEPDFQDAVALPAPTEAQNDGMLFAPALPPAPDTRFVFDQRGLVVATPDGALSPDGVMIFAGQPAVVPPGPRSGAGEATQQAEADAAEQAQQAQTASRRPNARPEDFDEKIERDGLSGRTRTELAALRPKLRPESAQEAAEAARKLAEAEAEATRQAAAAEEAAAADPTADPATDAAADPAAIEAAVAAAARATIAFSNVTPQAVNTSLKPRLKPRNIDRIVKRVKRNEQQQQQQRVQEADDEGETAAVQTSQRVTAKIPTKTSVSKQATQRNAMKFARVNLIGVYGTPNSRRALVRMSNGRYKKVKVGDRLDGGRVNAIGDSDLRYQKGGRIVVLKMPRG